MDFRDTPTQAAFREEVRTWLAEHLTDEIAAVDNAGGLADESDWTTWHRDLGETAMAVLGARALTIERDAGGKGYELGDQHRNSMASRVETIDTGSREIQPNIIGERVLGLPRELRELR